MGFWELVFIAVGLSMDAFAVALCKGLEMRQFRWQRAGVIAVFFGGFQGLMPLLGWLLGRRFEAYITQVDHWIAFLLLAVIGGKMIVEGAKKPAEDEKGQETVFSLKELLVLAIATSIDALAVGITFAFLQVRILPSSGLIAATTCLLSFGGVWIGHKFGAKLQNKAELIGGVILVGIGLKILLEHLGVLG